jgi:hypothetical protein
MGGIGNLGGAGNTGATTPGSPETRPIDMSCSNQDRRGDKVFVAWWPPPTNPPVPPDCLSGIEVNNAIPNEYAVDSRSTYGAAGRVIEVDIATYWRPDELRIYAVDSLNNRTLMLSTCRMRTNMEGDTGDGYKRPDEQSIRYYQVNLPAATRRLIFDYTGTDSPTYMRVLGLCDFQVEQVNGLTGGGYWRTTNHR